jgi:hypothetical protein
MVVVSLQSLTKIGRYPAFKLPSAEPGASFVLSSRLQPNVDAWQHSVSCHSGWQPEEK